MDRIKVDIDGMNFYVVGSDDQEKIQKMAGELTQKIQETAKANYRLNQVQGLVLTALNLLNDLHQAQENLDDLASENPENEKIQKSQEENQALKKQEQKLLEEKRPGRTSKRPQESFRPGQEGLEVCPRPSGSF